MRRAWALSAVLFGIACGCDAPPQPRPIEDAAPIEKPDAGGDPQPTGCADPLPDGDADGVCDADDICPATPDPDQLDSDFDGLGDACSPPPAGACFSEGLCHVGPGPLAAYSPDAVPIGRELYLLGSNRLGHLWDGTRWIAFAQPFAYTWLSFGATAGALWGLELEEYLDTAPTRLTPELWRRDRGTGAWTSTRLPFHATSIGAVDDTHVWVTDGSQLALFDGGALGPVLSVDGVIEDIVGAGAGEAFARGDRLWHFDGAAWRAWPVQPCAGGIRSLAPARGVPWVQCVEGTGTRLVRWDGAAWVEEVASLPADALVPTAELGVWLRTDSTIRRADGSGFHRLPQGLPRIVAAVGGPLWHASDQGAAAEWDGTRWIERGLRAPVVTATTLAPGGELWAVGERGFVARRRGNRWERVEVGIDEHMLSVASNGREVWLTAGYGHAARRLADGSWRVVSDPSFFGWGPIAWLSRSTSGTGWLVGFWGALREDLATGALLPMPTPGVVRAVAGDDEARLWAATSEGLVHWTGREWTLRREGLLSENRLDAMGDAVWATVDDKLVRLAPGGDFEELPFDDDQVPTDLVVRGVDEAFVRGDFGGLHRHDGERSRIVRASGCRRVVESDRGVECVTDRGIERAEDRAWREARLVSTGNRLLRRRGERWEEVGRFHAGDDASWTDGHTGLLLTPWGELWRHRDGRWRRELSLGTGYWSTVVEVDGAVFASARTSDASIIVRAQAGRVEEIWRGTHGIPQLRVIEGALVAVGGDPGLLRRWDGQRWHDVAPAGVIDPAAFVHEVAAGGAPGELWVAAGPRAGRLLHRLGARWEWVEVPSSSVLHGVWAQGEQLWALGLDGLWERTRAGWRRRDAPADVSGTSDGEDGLLLDGGYEGLWHVRPMRPR